MAELLPTLNANSSTLTHLCLSAYLARPHSWDSAFQSPTIDHLTRLDLVDTKVSHYVLRWVVTCSERLTHLSLSTGRSRILRAPGSSSGQTTSWKVATRSCPISNHSDFWLWITMMTFPFTKLWYGLLDRGSSFEGLAWEGAHRNSLRWFFRNWTGCEQ